MSEIELKQLAKSVIEQEFGSPSPKDIHYVRVIQLMMEFGKQIGDLQIKECAKHYKAEYNYLTRQYTDGTTKFIGTKQSILNTPNVCEI